MNGPTFVASPPPPHSTALVPAPVPRARVKPAPRPEPTPPQGPAVLTYLKLHWLTILFCGALAGGGLGYAAFSLVPVKYESFAEVQVASSPFAVTNEADPQRGQTAFAVYIKTARILMRGEPVLTNAVSDPTYKIDKLETLKREADPVKFLREKLVIETPEGSEIIRVSLEGEHQADLKPIVDAVLDSYKRIILENEINEKRRALAEIQSGWQSSYEALKKQAGGTQATKANFAPLAPPPPDAVAPLRTSPDDASTQPLVRQASATAVAAVAEGQSVLDTPEMKKALAATLLAQVSKANEELGKLEYAIPEAEKRAAERKAEAEALKPAEPSATALAAAANDPEVVAHRHEAARRDEEVRQFGTVNNPNSPSAQAARRNAQQAHEAVENLRHAKASVIENAPLAAKQAAANQAAKEAADLVPRLIQSQENVKKIRKDSLDRLAAIRLPTAATEKDVEKEPLLNPFQVELLSRGDVFSSQTKRMVQLSLEIAAPSRVAIPKGGASMPREKDGKKPLMAALAATLAGFGLIAAALVGNEIRLRKVSALGELAGTGAKVLGVVPFSPDTADPVKRGDIAESVNKLRAAVAQEFLGRGPATILVTSPLADEGKAFCAYRLAVSLAQAGARTLLVDFDLRNPAVHIFAGVPNNAGVADVLRGEADVRANQVILPSGLVVLPAGEWDSNGEATGSYPSLGSALDPLLNRLRADVDVLIVHGHAILTAADSVELARRCDAVLLCAAYRETRVPFLKRAAERVAGMNGPAAAVVYIGATRHEALC